MSKTTQILLFLVGSLLVFGLVILGSSSVARAMAAHHNPLHFLARQGIWLGLAFLVFVTAMMTPIRILRMFIPAIFIVNILLLAYVLLFTDPINGARRWMSFGGISFQPSELAKFTTILLVSWWMSIIHHRSTQFWKGFVAPGLIVGFMAGMVFLGPDYGTTILICAVGGILMFLAGSRLVFLLLAGSVGLGAFGFLVMGNPVRRARVFAWLDPMAHQGDEGLQLVQSLQAFQRGGATGVGPSNVQQTFYLPEAHTDFIFPIAGEAYGYLGSASTVLCFACIFLCGIKISVSCKDTFGKLLGYGITFVIAYQALINMMVCTGILPTKGIALPFMSYGGSHLIVTAGMLGVLMSIGLSNLRNREESPYERTPDEFY